MPEPRHSANGHGTRFGHEFRAVVRDGQEIRQLRCPRCGTWGDIDDDQYHGRVSIFHDEPGCLHALHIAGLVNPGA